MQHTQTTHTALPVIHWTHKQHIEMNRVSSRFILRNEALNSNQLAPLCYKVSVNGAKAVIPLHIYLSPEAWDQHGQKVKSEHPSANEINCILAECNSRKFKILANANMQNHVLSKESFRQAFQMEYNDNCFIAWAKNNLQKRAGNIGKGSLKGQMAILNKLQDFKSKIPFTELTHELLENFEKHLIAKGNNINTRHNAMKVIKTYVHRAIKSDIHFKNPFLHYKAPKGESQRTFLDQHELNQLLQAHDNKSMPVKLRSSLLYYLVSCFTSLRISDVKKLSPDDIKNNTIIIKPHKTRKKEKVVNIPVSKVAERLIAQIFEEKIKMKAEQKVNDDLKIIALRCEIDKNITFHTARHTFATLFLQLGGKVETLKAILGHTNITTTMEYVHLTDKRKEVEMQNFDKHFI